MFKCYLNHNKCKFFNVETKRKIKTQGWFYRGPEVYEEALSHGQWLAFPISTEEISNKREQQS